MNPYIYYFKTQLKLRAVEQKGLKKLSKTRLHYGWVVASAIQQNKINITSLLLVYSLFKLGVPIKEMRNCVENDYSYFYGIVSYRQCMPYIRHILEIENIIYPINVSPNVIRLAREIN
jgi:hypothetical protein